MDDAQALFNHNLDLRAELKKKDEKLEVAEDSHKKVEVAHKKAKELVETNAKKLEDSRAALLAYMQEAKVSLDAVLRRLGGE